MNTTHPFRSTTSLTTITLLILPPAFAAAGPIGACCFPDGSCIEQSQTDCEADPDGIWRGISSTCAEVNCMSGSCCDAFGNCSQTTQAGCPDFFQGFGTDCRLVSGAMGQSGSIPDNGGFANPLVRTFQFPAVGANPNIIGDVDVWISSDHTWIGDLVITLELESTEIVLIDRPGSPPGAGCGADGYAAWLNDEGTGGAIEFQCPGAGAVDSPPDYTPQEALSAFDGMNTVGLWTLTASDHVAGQSGDLSFGLRFTPAFPNECNNIPAACCTGFNSCDTLNEDDCALASGDYLGPTTDCSNATCGGACCTSTTTCQDTNETECEDLAGSFQGHGTDCAHVNCSAPTSPGIGDDTCWTSSMNTGIPCSLNADCTTLPTACGLKSRYITIDPLEGTPTSVQVTIVSMPQFPARVGEIWWAAVEVNVTNSPHPPLRGAPLVCSPTPTNAQVWTTGYLHLWGAAVVPNSVYAIRQCSPAGANCSPERLVATGKWGDVSRPFGGGAQPSFGDISEMVAKFGNVPSAPSTPRTDIVGPQQQGTPNTPNQSTSFADISQDVAAFQSFPYPYTVPACP